MDFRVIWEESFLEYLGMSWSILFYLVQFVAPSTCDEDERSRARDPIEDGVAYELRRDHIPDGFFGF